MPEAAPHNSYRCLGDDRWCAIAVFTDEQSKAFVRVIGNPSSTRDPGLITLSGRKRREDEIDKLVEEWTTNHTAEDIMGMMQGCGVPAGVVENAEDMLEHDPQMRHRGFFRRLNHPEVGMSRAPGPPYIMSGATPHVGRAPLLGEHNEYVLKEIAHLSEEEISDLVAQGVVE